MTAKHQGWGKTNFSWMQSTLQVQHLKPQHDATKIMPGTGACWRNPDPRKTTTYRSDAYSSFSAQARSALQTDLHKLQINEAV